MAAALPVGGALDDAAGVGGLLPSLDDDSISSLAEVPMDDLLLNPMLFAPPPAAEPPLPHLGDDDAALLMDVDVADGFGDDDDDGALGPLGAPPARSPAPPPSSSSKLGTTASLAFMSAMTFVTLSVSRNGGAGRDDGLVRSARGSAPRAPARAC